MRVVLHNGHKMVEIVIVLENCTQIFVLYRFIARLEEQIHEWKLNTVTQGPPLTKVSTMLLFAF